MHPPGPAAARRLESPVASLRRFATRGAVRPAVEERCELCNARLGPEHRHLLEPATRQIACACDPCALRFEGVIGGRFALVPRTAYRLSDFALPDAQWESFALPIDLAFIVRGSEGKPAGAFYPGPAGAVESLLALTAWDDLAGVNPVLLEMQPAVEALLVDRRGTRRNHYLTPIDLCYHLVGLIRLHWTGLSGGSAAQREIDGFFSRLEGAPARSSRGMTQSPEILHA